MKSKTFCCNGTLIRRTIQRGLPLWVVYLLLMLVALPGRILSWDSPEVLWVQDCVLSGAVTCHPVAFVYGPAVALLVFSYLYKSTSANFYGALPITRSAQFNSQYLAGLLMQLIPNAAVCLLTMAAGFIQNINVVQESGIFFAAQTLTFLFYYNFAVLVAMITGNLMAMPVLYLVLNFMAVVIELMVRTLLETFLFGMTFSEELVMRPFSPLINALTTGSGPRVETVSTVTEMGLYEVQGYVFTGWQNLLILAAVGVVFGAAAFLFYRHRRMESAGDVIAIRRLKPVALYLFTFGCALVLGIGFHMFFGYYRNFLLVAVCMIVGGTVGYFFGEMILHRSIRVFRKRNLINCGICAVILMVGLLCVQLDLLGLTEYMPEREEVDAVSMEYHNSWSEDPQLIDQVMHLHEDILENRDVLDREKDTYFSFYIRYRLKGGKVVIRRYALPAYQGDHGITDQLQDRYLAAANDPDYIVIRSFVSGYTAKNIRECHIYSYGDNGYGGEVYLTPTQAMEFLDTALVPDLRESSMDKLVRNTPTVEYQEGMPYSTGIGVDITFDEKMLGGQEYERNYFYFQIPSDAQRVLAYLEAYDVRPSNNQPEAG